MDWTQRTGIDTELICHQQATMFDAKPSPVVIYPAHRGVLERL